jgi:hypothetical protein
MGDGAGGQLERQDFVGNWSMRQILALELGGWSWRTISSGATLRVGQRLNEESGLCSEGAAAGGFDP